MEARYSIQQIKALLINSQTIQTTCLRLSCGAMRTTPAIALQQECGEMPLHLRRHKLLLQYSIKLKANIKNPANSVLKNTWENHYGKYKQGAEPVYNITHSFLEKIGNIEQFHTSEQPTWHLPLGNTDLSLHKYVSKKDNLEILKSYAIEHISKFTGFTHIYTDGSKLTSGVTGASFFDKTNDEKQCVRLSNNITIYTAELIAIKLAMQWLITKGIVGKVAIFSDSLSAIQSLETGISTSKPNLLLGVRKLLKQINMENRCEITFSWIPSHVGIIGNEMADTLAKLATSKSQVDIDLPREVKDVYFDIDKHIMNTWQEEYNKSKTGTHYKTIEPNVTNKIKYSAKLRRKDVTITRLRLGHCSLNHYLYRIKKHATGLCSHCNVQETIEHFLMNCPHYNIKKQIGTLSNTPNSTLTIQTMLSDTIISNRLYEVLITTGRKI